MMGRESTQALNLSPLAPLSGAALRGKGFSLVPRAPQQSTSSRRRTTSDAAVFIGAPRSTAKHLIEAAYDLGCSGFHWCPALHSKAPHLRKNHAVKTAWFSIYHSAFYICAPRTTALSRPSAHRQARTTRRRCSPPRRRSARPDRPLRADR